MAISFDSAATSSAAASSPFTLTTHTVGSGSNTVLIIAVAYVSPDTISTVARDSVNATQITAGTAGQFGVTVALYYIINPSTGNKNITVTLSGTPSNAVQGVMASSYFGVDQTTPIDATGDSGGGGVATSFSGSVTTVTDQAWPFMGHDMAGGGTGASPTAGSNTTVRAAAGNAGNGAAWSFSDSNGGVSVGSYTLNINQENFYWIRSVAALRPAASAAAATPHRMMMVGIGK